MEALRAYAQVPAAKGSWNPLILLNTPKMRHSCLILLAFLAFQSAKLTDFFWGATGRGWVDFGGIKFCRQFSPIQHNLGAVSYKNLNSEFNSNFKSPDCLQSCSLLNTFIVYTIKYMHTSLQKQGPKGNGWECT